MIMETTDYIALVPLTAEVAADKTGNGNGFLENGEECDEPIGDVADDVSGGWCEETIVSGAEI